MNDLTRLKTLIEKIKMKEGFEVLKNVDCTPVDLNQKGSEDFICFSTVKDEYVEILDVARTLISFEFDQDNSFKTVPYLPEKLPTDKEVDFARREKVTTRFKSIFPGHPFFKRFYTPKTQDIFDKVPTPEEREYYKTSRLIQGEPPSIWKSIVNFLVAPNRKAVQEDQLKLLEEIANIEDPYFLIPLAHMTEKGVRVGKVSWYSESVLQMTVQTLETLIPKARIENLMYVRKITEKQLENLNEYSKDEVSNFELTSVIEKNNKRAQGLLNKIDEELRARFKSSTENTPTDLTNSPHYISTHYQFTAIGFVRTFMDIPSDLFNLIVDSNYLNIFPRLTFGMISSIVKGVYNIPEELFGLLSAGKYGFNGGELGENIANTTIAISFLYSLKSYLAKKLAPTAEQLKAAEELKVKEEVAQKEAKEKAENAEREARKAAEIKQKAEATQQEINTTLEELKKLSEQNPQIKSEFDQANTIAEDLSQSLKYRLDEVKRLLNEAKRKLKSVTPSTDIPPKKGIKGGRDARKAQYQPKTNESDVRTNASDVRTTEPDKLSANKKDGLAEKSSSTTETPIHKALETPPEILTEETLSHATEEKISIENGATLKLLKDFYDRTSPNVRKSFWRAIQNILTGRKVNKLAAAEFWRVRIGDFRIIYEKLPDGKYQIKDFGSRDKVYKPYE